MVSIDHLNAEFYFKRDVDCVRTFFRRRFDYELDEFPVLAEIAHEYTLDLELKASGADEKPLSFGSALDEIQLNGVAADAEHDDEATSDVDEEAVAATSDDAEKAGSDIEERMSMCTVTTSIAPEEIKKRLLKVRKLASLLFSQLEIIRSRNETRQRRKSCASKANNRLYSAVDAKISMLLKNMLVGTIFNCGQMLTFVVCYRDLFCQQ